MAGHEWEDWFTREEFIGQISDIRVQNLQVEREVVQKRTFTRWMNLHLEKCDPPTEVQDLFRDIQDGRVLMALLEELSGCKLLHGFKKSSHRIFRLNNIAKVLTFLEERNVKLVSIDAADIADGNSSIILGLIWNIILFFQIKELTGNIRSQFPSTSSLSSIPTSSDSDTSHSSTPSEERRAPSAAGHAGHGRAIKKLLQWVQKRTRKYGVAVQDFGKSWTSGLAFLAVIKSIDPSLVDMRRALLRSPRENLEEAFRTAHYTLGIPRLLEPEDVTISRPEEQCIMTYVSQFLEHFPGIEEPEQPSLVIERSVSMGRLNTCDLDSDHQVKNSLDRSRLKKRPCTADKDWPQHPPPRIFLSSVSEDRGVAVSLTHNPSRAGARSWASEDSLLDPGPSADADGEPRDPEVTEMFTVSTARSPQPLYVHSPVGSPSAIGDSAIGSPESWQEDGRWGESPSDGSLCDSGTTWDVGVSHAEEATTPNEGLTPSSVDTLPDEQLMPEMLVDEGVYSLSSIESTKERIQSQLETEQEEGETGQANLDFNKSLWAAMHVPEEKMDENKAEQEHEGMNGGQLEMGRDSVEEPLSLKCCNGTEKVISEDGSSSEPVEVDRSRPDLNTNLLTSHLFLEFKEQNSVEASSQGDNEESGAIVNAEIVDVEEEPVSLCDLYFDLTSTVNAEVGLPAEPTESNLVLLGGDLTDPPNICQETLNAASISVVGTGPDGDGPDEAESCDSGAHAKVSPAHQTSIQHTGMGLFYTNIDSSLQSEELFGEALEPMDLFYPDKEDVMLTDPAETDTEFLPPVFGVFALQPAPVSEPLLPDIDHTWEETDVGNPKVPDEDYDNGEKLAMEKMEEGVDKELESRQLSGSAPKLPMDVTGGMGPAEQVGPTEDGHLSRDDGEGKMQSIAKGNTEPMSDEEHSGRPGEDLLPTVLRHRKAPGVFNSSDKQMIVPIIKINSTNADLGEGPLQDRELYLILLLWLLLYCLWLLPQMELRALPSLLFNLDH
ncbi:unnamed protein product [Merluccius merluccius]